MNINYLTGDATAPKGQGKKVIVHICNDIGKWGRGFVLAISKRWKTPEQTYRQAFSNESKLELGEVQFIEVNEEITVANIIGQHDIARKSSKNIPIRYPAVKQALEKVTEYAKQQNASVHMPRIGCGLAGGNWDSIEPIIIDTLIQNNISTSVYDFEASTPTKTSKSIQNKDNKNKSQ